MAHIVQPLAVIMQHLVKYNIIHMGYLWGSQIGANVFHHQL